jgi:hypothetical protein
MDILVFKTDIRDRRRVTEVEQHIENIEGILKWNVDLHDKDNILRIEAETISPRIIEQHLQQAGYYCEELED